MPHKKAKHSVRQEEQKKLGSDLAPGKDSTHNEDIPKSAARVLNASQIREDHRKRKLEKEGSDDRNPQKRKKTESFQPKIKPGESIQHFYRRVEDDMRPLVRSAVQASKAVERKARNTESEFGKKTATKGRKHNLNAKSAGQPPPPLSSDSGKKDPKATSTTERPKEFEKLSTSIPRRLNDIAQAPPEINRSPRNTIKAKTTSKREGIVSMAQKSLMEQEREKAIARYRMLKALRHPITENN